MGLGRHAGVRTEPGHLAQRVIEWVVWIAGRQGLHGKDFASLLWAHGNAIGNRVPAVDSFQKRLVQTSSEP